MKKIIALLVLALAFNPTPVSAAEVGETEAKAACIGIKAVYEGWLVTGERVGTVKGDAKYEVVLSRVTKSLLTLQKRIGSSGVPKAWTELETKKSGFKPVHVLAGGMNFQSTLMDVRAALEKSRNSWLPDYGTVLNSYSQNVEKPCSAYAPASKGALKGATIDAKIRDMASRLNALGYKCSLGEIMSTATFGMEMCGQIHIQVQDDRTWNFSNKPSCWAKVTMGTSWDLEVNAGKYYPPMTDKTVAAAVKFLKANASNLGGKLDARCNGK